MDFALGIRIRAAKAGDSDAVARLFGQAWASSLSMVPKMHTSEEDRIYFASVIREQQVYVAEEAGATRGFIALLPGWINHLYIDPRYHGRGIGSALIAYAKSLQNELMLWTFQGNAKARNFYERHGFVAMEFTDGSGNEERTPDVRYVWKRSD